MLSLSCQSLYLAVHSSLCISASQSVGLSDCLFTSLTMSLLLACLQVLVCLPLDQLWKGERTSGLDMASLDMGSTISQDIIGRTFSLYKSQPRHWINYISGRNGEDIQPRHISASTFFNLALIDCCDLMPCHFFSTCFKQTGGVLITTPTMTTAPTV